MWDSVDFLINKCYWSDKKYSLNLNKIRKRNLIDIIEASKKFNVVLFLEGKTLASIYLTNNFWPRDHDDDLGIFIEDYDSFSKNLVPYLLKKLNFKIIRKNNDMISLERDNRYIDICFFKKKSNQKIGYGNKSFNAKNFNNLKKIRRFNNHLLVPSKTLLFITKRYTFQFIYEIIRLVYIFFRKQKSTLLNLFKRKKKLKLEDFFELNIESQNSLNWKIRKPHLDLITNKGKYIKIKDVIDYLKKELPKIESKKLVSSNVINISNYPIHLNKSFWFNGNDFFINCIKYEFRRGVVPYNQIRKYLKSNSKYPVFSDKYYSSLESMNEKQINELFYENPIEIKNGSVVGGRHRVYAMMGRLVKGKSYIPITYYKLY